MKTVVALLMLCVVCAILKAVVVALAAALLFALLWSFISQPRETLMLLVTLALMGLVNALPIACTISVGLITIALVLVSAGRTRKPRRAEQLPRLQ